jgi:hypothetical protein
MKNNAASTRTTPIIRKRQRAAALDADSSEICIEYREEARIARRGAMTHSKPNPSAMMETNSPNTGASNESRFLIRMIYTSRSLSSCSLPLYRQSGPL